jgi:4-amino-4-deoxy-L-arabinose transferase-like glycosyltransferase
MRRYRSLLPVAAIFCLALLVRVVYNATVGHGYQPLYDAGYYNAIALNLIHEHCYCLVSQHSTLTRAPLWPWLIAIIYTVTGTDNSHARLFLCFVGSGTCAIVYLWTRDIFSQRIGVITGIVAAFYPGLFIYDGWLYTESLYTFLLLVFGYGLYRLQCTARLRWAVLSGLALAGAALTRPNGLLYLGVLVVWAIFVLCAKVLRWKTVVGGVLIVAFLTAVLIAPWTVRNYTVGRTFVPVAVGSGSVLLGAYNNQALADRKYGIPGMWIPPALPSITTAINPAARMTWMATRRPTSSTGSVSILLRQLSWPACTSSTCGGPTRPRRACRSSSSPTVFPRRSSGRR